MSKDEVIISQREIYDMLQDLRRQVTIMNETLNTLKHTSTSCHAQKDDCSEYMTEMQQDLIRIKTQVNGLWAVISVLLINMASEVFNIWRG